MSDDAWWADEPIGAGEQDRFDRAAFARRVTEILDEVAAATASTPVGLVGPWGSGKTSTLNMIIAGLDRERWGVSVVNPWASGDVNGIVSEILAAISAALPPGGKGVKARRALGRYGVYAAPLLSAVPVVGSNLEGLATTALERLNGESTLQDQAGKVADALTRLGRPLLIVLDDVDRLQPDEILALFRAVRALGRLPHVHYLMAYDEQTLIDVLCATPLAAGRPDRALAFLEKIVALRLDQPPTRPEQAEDMFTLGLRDALAAAGGSVTEEQQQRLAEEYASLLARTLTEPRGVSRFLTQLRIYLPIVGPAEIDIVDFLVLTHFRVRYPQLYRALAADRIALTDGEPASGQIALLLTGDGPHRSLGVPADEDQMVVGALRRLFPKFTTDPHLAAYHAEAGRSGRRASDPHYVDRYFALTLPSDDLSDTELLAAMTEWATDRPDVAAVRVEAVLRPDPRDRRACSLATRVVRRAEAITVSLPAGDAERMIPIVIGLLPDEMSSPGEPVYGVHNATVAWLSTLLKRATQLPQDDVVALFTRPAADPSPLIHLLQAIRLAAPEPLDGTALPAGSASWLDRLIDATVGATWLRFAGNVAQGDAAPAEPAFSYLRWLDDVITPQEVDHRIHRAVGDGLSTADFAARFVEVSTDLDTRRTTIVDFRAHRFVQRLGIGRLRTATEPVEQADDQDTSWRGRRIFAIGELSVLLARAETEPQSLLPLPRRQRPHPFVNHHPSILGPHEGREPELLVQVAFLCPAGDTLPDTGVGSTGRPEDVLLRAMRTSRIAGWLTDVAPSFRQTPADWSIGDSDNRTLTTVRAGTAPVLLGAQLRMAGPYKNDRAAQLLTISAGLWLNGLTIDRRPGGEPIPPRVLLPAALRPMEFLGLVTALLAGAGTAVEIYRAVVGELRSTDGISLHVDFRADAGIDTTVDLSDVRRVGASSPERYEAGYKISAATLRDGTLDPCLRAVGLDSVGNLLRRAGFRDFERTLYELTEG